MNDLQKYYEKYNNIENKIIENNIDNEQEILTNLKDDLENINIHKDLVNKSKSLMIKINKSKNFINKKKNIEKSINNAIDNLEIYDEDKIKNIIDNFKSYLNIDYNQLNSKLEDFIVQLTKKKKKKIILIN